MQFKDFVEATGATPRQIRYWAKVIPFTTNKGRYYDYNDHDVKKVRLLVHISNVFGGNFSVDAMAVVFERFDEGDLLFANGLALDWRDVNLDEAPD